MKNTKWIIILIIISFITIQYHSLFVYQTTDANVYFYMSKLIHNGLSPYKDFFLAHSPLQIWLFSLLYYFGNYNNWLFQSTMLLITILSSLMIYNITKDYSNENIGIIAMGLYLFNYGILGNAVIAMGVIESTFLMLIGFYFLKSKPLLSSVMLVMSVMYRFYTLFPIVVLLVVNFFVSEETSEIHYVAIGNNIKEKISKIISRGSNIINFGLFLIFINLGLWAYYGKEYLKDVFLYHFHKPVLNGYKMVEYLNIAKLLWVIIFLSIICILFINQEKIKQHKKFIMFCLFAILGFLGFLLRINIFFGYYFIMIIPFLCMLSAISLNYLFSFKHKGIIVFVVGIILIDIISNVVMFEHQVSNPFPRFKEASSLIKGRNLSLAGDSATVSLLALYNNIPIAHNEVDTNNMVYESGLKNISSLFEIAKEPNTLFVLRKSEGLYFRLGQVRHYVESCKLLNIYEEDFMFFNCSI